MLTAIHRTPGARRFYLPWGGLILVAWILLIGLQRSALAEQFGHEAIEAHDLPVAGRLAAFLMSWILMTVAMMLPGSLPLLRALLPPVRRRLGGPMVLGYLSSWALFGLLLYLGDSRLHRAAEIPPLSSYTGWIPAAILLIAGLYQLTPAKRSALLRCRPVSLHAGMEISKSQDAREAWGQGLMLGAHCLSSCGSLMLLMFAIGHNRLNWMLILGAVMAAERLAPWGQRLAGWVGTILVAWAILWAFAAI